MTAAGTVVLLLAALLIGAWLATAVAIFVKALRRGALLQRGNLQMPFARRLLLAVCSLPLILLLALGTIFNAIVFGAALGWYRLRGKALPDYPAQRTRRDDSAA
jgi:hypothetical protein